MSKKFNLNFAVVKKKKQLVSSRLVFSIFDPSEPIYRLFLIYSSFC